MFIYEADVLAFRFLLLLKLATTCLTRWRSQGRTSWLKAQRKPDGTRFIIPAGSLDVLKSLFETQEGRRGFV